MSKNRKSAAGRLYYTFGTIFLMAVITVCTMNFIKDSRIMNKPVVAAAAKVNEAGVAANTDSKTNEGKDDGKDGGTKESETKSTGTKSTGTKPAKTKPADAKPAETKPINPGEEP